MHKRFDNAVQFALSHFPDLEDPLKTFGDTVLRERHEFITPLAAKEGLSDDEIYVVEHMLQKRHVHFPEITDIATLFEDDPDINVKTFPETASFGREALLVITSDEMKRLKEDVAVQLFPVITLSKPFFELSCSFATPYKSNVLQIDIDDKIATLMLSNNVINMLPAANVKAFVDNHFMPTIEQEYNQHAAHLKPKMKPSLNYL